MSWLFLIGVSCDGVGAFLIAWPILLPDSAEREAARPRMGGDFWAPFVRDRERRLVQYGALFLVGGFALQASGYVVRLHHDVLAAVVLLGAVVTSGLILGTWLSRRGLPRHVWHPGLPPPDRIGDGLVVYGVLNIDDLMTVLGRRLREMRGKAVEPIQEKSSANVNGGSWMASCPRCNQPTSATTPDWGRALCTACGALFDVDYPDRETRRRIEDDLVREPDPSQRRWVVDPSAGG